jgi:hypothetical protein
MNFNIGIGYLIGLAILSAISSLFIKLGGRILGGQTVTFAKGFVISFISFGLALFFQILLDDIPSKNSLVEVTPGIIFFLSSWLLNAQFIKYGEADSTSYGKAFLSTIMLCVALFILGIVFSLVFVAILSSFGSSLRH